MSVHTSGRAASADLPASIGDPAVPGSGPTPAATGARPGPSRRTLPVAVLTMLGTGTSSQVGAALGAHAFAAIGPAGVVAVRQLVAAAVLLPVARPPLHRFSRRQWWPTL